MIKYFTSKCILMSFLILLPSISASAMKSYDNNICSEKNIKESNIATEIPLEKKDGFYILPINDSIFERINGRSFKKDCITPRKDLRYIHLLHVDFNGKTKEGEMIVNYHIADRVLNIFKKLYDAKYQIDKIKLVDEYDADDIRSMEDNNSSCFNYRLISGTNRVSKHGLGLAIDINTLFNPYVKVWDDGVRHVEPPSGEIYTDREKNFEHKIDHNDMCYALFKEAGFEWGGDWENRKDYQHFEIPNNVIEKWYPSDDSSNSKI